MDANRMILNYQDFFEVLSIQTGGFTLFLGVLLFFNLYLFFRGMNTGAEARKHKASKNIWTNNQPDHILC